MRYRITLAIAFSISLALVVVMLGTAHAIEGPCQNMGVKKTIRCATKRWPVQGDGPHGVRKALRVAYCESRYNPTARNGRFRGVYQIGYDTEWNQWLDRFPVMRDHWVRGIYDGRSNVLVAIRTAQRIGGFEPWACQ